jgi:oligopeptide/dipeptide ABC transporter ATP-binding protein
MLEVRDLRTHFHTRAGLLKAVDGVSFRVGAGETLAIVGESGSGKSVTALSILRLVPQPPGRIAGGQVLLDGVDLLTLPEARMAQVRGNAVSMIFQEPMAALNPVMTIGEQIGEVLAAHGRSGARQRTLELLDLVRIPDRHSRIDDYPHRLSGGMRQRVMIAMALACRPKVLIADEPTTALDVTIQAQILELLRELQAEIGMAMVFITHDLGVVAEIADRVVVMYAGRKVEEAPVADLFARPMHPYTQGLLAATASLQEIPGGIPSLIGLSPACPFADRCARVMAECRAGAPPRIVPGESREVFCFAASC